MAKSIKTKETLKQLQSQLSILKGRQIGLDENFRLIQKEISDNKNQIHQFTQKIANIEKQQSQSINVSEHALLRYCERVLGIDMEEIKSIINNDKLKEMVDTLGPTGTYPMDKFKIKVIDKTIVTIM